VSETERVCIQRDTLSSLFGVLVVSEIR
jgi:hypothetical protein